MTTTEVIMISSQKIAVYPHGETIRQSDNSLYRNKLDRQEWSRKGQMMHGVESKRTRDPSNRRHWCRGVNFTVESQLQSALPDPFRHRLSMTRGYNNVE